MKRCGWCDQQHTDDTTNPLPTGDYICPECYNTHTVVKGDDGLPRVVQVEHHSVLGAPPGDDET